MPRPSRVRTSVTRKRTLLGLLLVLAAGCGGSDGASPTDPSGPDLSRPARVVVAPVGDTLDWIGATVHLQASVLNRDGLDLGLPVSWSSSAPGVATVSSSGLVTAAGVGTTSIVASAEGVSATAQIVVRQVPVSLVKISGDDQEGPAGELLGDPLVVEVRDEGGATIPGAPLTWTVQAGGGAVESSSAETDAAGRGEAAWRLGGSATGQSVQVAAGSLTPVTFSAVAEEIAPPTESITITAVEPVEWIEGDTVLVRGTGFAAAAGGNAVRLDGVDAAVLSASTTELSVRVPYSDCRPARQAELVVSVGTARGTRTVPVGPSSTWSLSAGEGVYGGTCLHLEGGSGGEQYLVGTLSMSETPSSLTSTVLTGETGIALSSVEAEAEADVRAAARSFRVPLRAAGGAPSPPRLTPRRPVPPMPRAGEAEIRRHERAFLETLDPSALPAPRALAGAALQAMPTQGDTLDLKVPEGCYSGIPVQGVVRHVGSGVIFVEDVDNPVTPAFSAAELREMDDFYVRHTLSTLRSYFGSFADVDGNAQVLVLITQEVNKKEDVGGFVNSVDLVGGGVCSGGNEAEIFYGIAPDPQGLVGKATSAEYVKDYYPSLIAHEVTHILQRTAYLYRGASLKSTWEIEGGATLAEQLVGFEVLGHGPGQDLGWAGLELGIPGGWYSDWYADMAKYFGWTPDGKVSGAPEECSWMGREAEGNTGPCLRGRAPYGVPAMFLRSVLDRYGADHPGGEAGLMRELTGSARDGLPNLEEATGGEAELLMVLFGTALWADGRTGDWITSWNLADIFDSLEPAARLDPARSISVAPIRSATVRAGSNAYLLWTPPSGHAPTSLKIRSPSGGALPGHMVLWVLRVR